MSGPRRASAAGGRWRAGCISMKSGEAGKLPPSGGGCYAGVLLPLAGSRKNIVLISASGILDVQSLVSSGKFEREFGKLEL